MRPSFLACAAAAAATALTVSPAAHAGDAADLPLPAVVEYSAPDGCPSPRAFRELLKAESEDTSRLGRPWRFSVGIARTSSGYRGTLTTEHGTRVLDARSCDEVAGALAMDIALAAPDPGDAGETGDAAPPAAPSAATPPAAPPAPSAPAASPPPPAPVALARTHAATPADDASGRKHAGSGVERRIGLRMQHLGDGSQLSANGPSVTASYDFPFGLPRMEIGVGLSVLLQPPLGTPDTTNGASSSVHPWLLLDGEVCPIDVPIASTGLAVLGCGRIAIGEAGGYGFVGWAGGGGRVRWQSPWRLWVDAHLDGLYGTRIEGIPALMDAGGGIGVDF